jgi:hypothetical protein
MNSVLDSYENDLIAITSIGLDGEEIDQVTFMEKPRVYARNGYILATAKDTLSQCEASYRVLEETDIQTPIGKILILEVTKPGNALIAGPSIVFDMERLVGVLSKYSPKKIFIDGAFFRHSLAKISEATIFVVGANLTSDIDKVVDDAVATTMKFELDIVDENISDLIINKNVSSIDSQGKLLDFGFESVIGNTEKIFVDKNKNVRFLYLPKSLTNEFVLKLVELRHEFRFDIILESPVNIQLNISNLMNLFKLKNKVYVRNQVNLVAVCYNPVSPRGYIFDNDEFMLKLQDALKRKVYHVKEDYLYE